MGGVTCPAATAQTVRLPRGASLTDFAEQINAKPGSLVQVVFTSSARWSPRRSRATTRRCSCSAPRLGCDVQVVSPEDEDRELLETFDLTFGDEYGDEDNS